MKAVLTKVDVEKAISDLVARGKKATMGAIHAALEHRGSMTTLMKLKAEIETAAQTITDSPEGVKTFREVWELAKEEGRQQLTGVADELRESIKALASENERLEGVALAAQNRATDAERIKARVEGEVNQVRSQLEMELKLTTSAFAEASAKAAVAFQSLAETQAAHAKQVDSLKSEISAATQKSHALELQVARTTALLEAKNVELPAAPAKKSKATAD
jgi:hypothetical protein